MIMKKILITENQLGMIKSSLNETINNERYRREVNVRIRPYRANFKGKEINDVTANEGVFLTFLIDMEHRSWGVKNVSLYDIRGEQTLNVKVDYFVDEDTEDYEDVNITLDWDKLETESIDGEGIITIGDTLEIELSNDQNGNLIVGSMSIEVYKL